MSNKIITIIIMKNISIISYILRLYYSTGLENPTI